MSVIQPNDVPEHKERYSTVLVAIIGIIGALLGAIITIIGNYVVTYKAIEAPKIEIDKRRVAIDEKKVSIEAHKMALALTPNIISECDQKYLDAWTWKFTCNSKNDGIYPVFVKINDVSIALSSDVKGEIYRPGQGFEISFPNQKDGFSAVPGGDGLLWFYINFDKSQFKDGVVRRDLVAKIVFNYKTIESVKNYIVTQFPELIDIANDTVERSSRLTVDLLMPN